VTDDAIDFYGRGYWFEHQENCLGLPNIEERAVWDLRERCIYWLKHMLEWRLPPARVLELGCAHGGSVALMKLAGYDAVGVELSPWIVDFAQRTFNVQVLRGPVEDLDLPAQSFDVICLFDVLEHLPDPLRTLSFCSRLLKNNGIFLIQTPEIPDHADYELMRRNGNVALNFLADEHLFLFSRKAVKKVFAELGFNHLEFMDQLFPYDMFFVASRRKLHQNRKAFVEQELRAHASSRIALAMLQLFQDNKALRQQSAWRQALPGRQSIRRLLHLIRRGEFNVVFDKFARLMSSRRRKNDRRV